MLDFAILNSDQAWKIAFASTQKKNSWQFFVKTK